MTPSAGAEPEINDRPRRRMPAQDDGRQNEREETCRQERDDGQQPEINSLFNAGMMLDYKLQLQKRRLRRRRPTTR